MDCTGIYDQQYDIGDTEVLKKMIIPPKLWNCFFSGVQKWTDME